MKAHEFAVIVAGSAVLFFGGALIVGTQFMKKTYEYGSEWADATDEKEGRRRAEKIAYAQDANAENHQTKLLREQLEKARYGKRTTRQDLEKLLRTSDEELKIWYYAEDAEDIDQVRAYISYYAEKAETLRPHADVPARDRQKETAEPRVRRRRRAEENRRARGAARKASRGGAGNGGGNPRRARKTGRNPQPSRRRSVRAQDLSRSAEPDGRRAAAYRRHSAHQKRNHGVGNRRRRQKNQHLFLTFPRRIPSRRGDGNALRRRFRLRRENRRRGA